MTLIIGLVGGTESRRDRLAGQAQAASKGPLPVYAMYSPSSGAQRAELLAGIVATFAGLAMPSPALLLSHIRTLEEAQFIRAQGGILWHLQGAPSAEVSILRSDLMVTERSGGDRHYLDVTEALSESRLRIAAT